ncbi:hypothetical protein J7E88_32415 [Streptomyces sp. ISL-10]|uniref:hypothetical protein n=1 Tax=Streptomyces sp. ISL-10 TaxID=2819172 RepID=UPI001BEA9467|nr:hypothetical protein [Streptomyces sp. ISL-10]MBT2369850.1 hypothetical protein [Streptomyces sp. ISL-10]
MLALALLLVLATGAFAAIAVVENFSGGPEYTVEIFGNQIATLNAPGLFLSGVGLALLFCLGLAMLTSGRKRRHHVREPVPDASTAGQREADRPPSQPVHRHRGWRFRH